MTVNQGTSQQLKDIFIFCAFYIPAAIILLPSTYGGQTKAMLVIVAIVVMVLTIVYSMGALLLMNGFKYVPNIFIQGIVFFLANEIARLTFDAQVAFFGLLVEMPTVGKDPDMTEALAHRLFEHRQRVAIAFSLSAAIAFFLFIITRMFIKRKA